jgi:hypothetical protein
MNLPDSMAKNMPKIAEVKFSSCGLEVADLKLRTSGKIAIAELRSCGCGATFLSKVAELGLRKCFLQVAELRLRTQKKCPPMKNILRNCIR